MPEQVELAKRLATQVPGLFASGQAVSIARAPGRLDVMGGIADYSGSLVLELPLRHATLAAVQICDTGKIDVVSIDKDTGNARKAMISGEKWKELHAQHYGAAREWFASLGEASWLAYVAGPLLVLAKERGGDLTGFRVLVESDVPEGKGVSSSAAIEVATMRAAASVTNVALTGIELASLCQLAENDIAGAPCGIMDQMTSALGQESHLLALRCQPANVEGHVTIPEPIGFWGIDSGIRHQVSGFDYGAVRVAAFMGYRMIAAIAGMSVTRIADGKVDVDDPKWNGYLANIAPDEFEERFSSFLPDRMKGSDFLSEYEGITDNVTHVEPDRTYPVFAATRHPIEECARVGRFRELLLGGSGQRDWEEMGQLMDAGHESYSACGLGSEGTDALVALCRQAGPDRGIFGARITGGGSGGTVAILARSDAAATIREIADRYEQQTNRTSFVFANSSPGANQVATHRFFA